MEPEFTQTGQTPEKPVVEVLHKPDDRDVQENKDLAALSYVWVLSVVVYLSHRSPFVRFHARQGMVLFALSVVVWFIPVIGRFLELIILALSVIGFLAAAQGEQKKLPIIHALSEGNMHGVREGFRSILHMITSLWKKVRRKTGNSDQPPAQSTPTDVPPNTPSL